MSRFNRLIKVEGSTKRTCDKSDPGQEHVRIKHCKAMDQEANLNNSQSIDKGNNGFTNKRKINHKKE